MYLTVLSGCILTPFQVYLGKQKGWILVKRHGFQWSRRGKRFTGQNGPSTDRHYWTQVNMLQKQLTNEEACFA